jgi:hypothetical protein
MKAVGFTILLAAFAGAAAGQRPPPPDPAKPVDYAAWLNEQFAVPEARNAAGRYREAVEALVADEVADRFSDFLNGGWTDEERGKVAAWIARNERALALWREAAAMPACRFPYKNEPRLMLDAPLSALRSLTRLAILRAWLNLERGPTADGLDDVTAMLRMVRHLESQGDGIPQLLSLAYRKTTYQALLRAANALDAAASRQMLVRLRESDGLAAPQHLLILTRLQAYDFNQRYAVDDDGDGALDCVRRPGADPLVFPPGTTWARLIAETDEYARNCERILAQPDYPSAMRRVAGLHNPVLAEFVLPGLPASDVRMYDWLGGLCEQIAKPRPTAAPFALLWPRASFATSMAAGRATLRKRRRAKRMTSGLTGFRAGTSAIASRTKAP